MTTESPELDEATQPSRTLSDDDRGLLWAWGASALLHGLLFGTIMTVAAFTPEIDIAFDPSSGVALMSRLGIVADGDEDAEMPDEIPDDIDLSAVSPNEEPVVEPVEEAAEEEPVEEETVEEEPVEEPTAEPEEEQVAAVEPEPEPEPEAEPVVVPAPRDDTAAPNPRDREARPTPPRPRAEENANVLPPSVRYPEGTLNPISTDVGMWGPEGAVLTVVMRADRIRRSDHRDEIEEMIEALPDWRNLVAGADINPFSDVDAMLIATSDPSYVTRTFLAAVHRMDPVEVMEKLSRGYGNGVRWEETDGLLVGTPLQTRDPRQFVVPAQNLFILSRQEFIDDLRRGAPDDDGLERVRAWVEDPEAFDAASNPPAEEARPEPAGRPGRLRPNRRGTPTPAREVAPEPAAPEIPAFEPTRFRPDEAPPLRGDGWVQGLQNIADFGGTGDGPAIVISAQGFSNFQAEGMGDAVGPQAIHLSAYADDDPRFTGRFVFRDRDEALAWVRAWPDMVAGFQGPLSLVGLYGPMRDATWEVDHNEATVEMILDADTLARAAETIGTINAARLGRD